MQKHRRAEAICSHFRLKYGATTTLRHFMELSQLVQVGRTRNTAVQMVPYGVKDGGVEIAHVVTDETGFRSLGCDDLGRQP